MAGFRVLLIFLIVSTSAWAQDGRYIISFTDKNNTPYSIGQPEAFLSARSITRRSHSNIAVTSEDLPVTPSYVTQVRAKGAKAFFTSRWMNAVLVEGSSSVIAAVASLPFVLKTELVAPGKKLIGGRSKFLTQTNTTNAEASTTQLEMLGLDFMHEDGYLGEGILISILDGGFSGANTATPFQSVYAEGRIGMTQDFVTNSGNVYQFSGHGTEVFSVIAAQLSGSFTGGAYHAKYLLFVTEDVNSEYRIEEYNWLFAAEKADSAGTDIIQSSLGYSEFDDPKMDYKITDLTGKTAIVSKAAGMARDRAIVVVVSAGNEGLSDWHYITPPADADGILASGAVNATYAKVGFSSFGPTADGRIKPDVVALGQNTSVILPDGNIGFSSGTSFASPLVTSLVAGLLQAHPELKPAEIIQAIKLSANLSNTPNNSFGYGLPNYRAVQNYLEANKSGEEIIIYPNPVQSTLHLAFRKLPSEPISLYFYDLQGRLLSNPSTTLQWLNNPLTISVTNLTAGMYFLQIKTASVLQTFRFVKF